MTRSILFAIAILFGASCQAQDRPGETRVTLRIGYLKGTSDLTLAKAHGSLERALEPRGVKLVWAGPFSAAAPAIDALNAGAVDLTSGSSTSYVAARAAGVKLTIFGYQPQSEGNEGLVVRAGSPLKSVVDLEGRTVAVNRGGTGEYLLVRALNKAGVQTEAVKRSYLQPADAATALAGGHVDAWATWDPFLSIVLESGVAQLLANGTQANSENAVAYFVSDDFLAAHRDVVKVVFEVLTAENAWSEAHKVEAGEIWVKELGLPERIAARLGAYNTNTLGPVRAEQLTHIEHIADWYLKNKIISERPDIAHFVTDITR